MSGLCQGDWQAHFKKFSCMVTTSCISVAVSNIGAEWLVRRNVI